MNKGILTFILLVFCSLNAEVLIAQNKPNIDGQSFMITVTLETGKKWGGKWPIDTLVFGNGKMVSLYMQRRERFNPAAYHSKTNQRDSTTEISFKYENYNPGGSFLDIEGKASGNSINGNIRWTSLSGNRRYSFEGVLL